ncbi:MAG: hypothetical protein R3B70_40965 [Polyangiaceae bacterium]
MSIYAALLAQIEQRLAVDGKLRFLSIPALSGGLDRTDFLLDPEELLKEGLAVNEGDAVREAVAREYDLSLLLNEVPAVGPDFQVRNRPMDAVLPLFAGARTPPAREDLALLLQTLSAPLAEPRRTNPENGLAYSFTSTLPPPGSVLRDGAWVKLTFQAETIARFKDKLSPPLAEWLSRRDLLVDPFGEEWEIARAECEVLPLVVVRPWFPEALLVSRIWTWSGAPLSDGADPPSGQLPARIVTMILCRRFSIELEKKRSASPGVGPTPAKPVFSKKATLFKKQALFAKPSFALVPGARRLHAVQERLAAKASVSASPSTPTAPAAASAPELAPFSVPARVVARSLVEDLSAALVEMEKAQEKRRKLHALARAMLESTEAGCARHQAEVTRLERALSEAENPPAPGELKPPRPRLPPGLFPHGDLRDAAKIAALTEELERARKQLARATERAEKLRVEEAKLRSEIEEAEAAMQEARTARDEVSAMGDDQDRAHIVHILAFLCERTPKSPDPDPALFG